MKITAVILHYKIDENDDARLFDTIKSLDVDEIIIADEKTDHVTKKINKALKQATGDYVIVCGNDNPVIEGSTRDLPVKGTVTTDQLENFPEALIMTMTCFPRNILVAINYYDEDIMCTASDEDILKRLNILKIPCKVNNKVVVKHGVGGRTTERIPTFAGTRKLDISYYNNKYENLSNNS